MFILVMVVVVVVIVMMVTIMIIGFCIQGLGVLNKLGFGFRTQGCA